MQKIVGELLDIDISQTNVTRSLEICYHGHAKDKVLFMLWTYMRRSHVLGFWILLVDEFGLGNILLFLYFGTYLEVGWLLNLFAMGLYCLFEGGWLCKLINIEL